jgi:hypothetical protein
MKFPDAPEIIQPPAAPDRNPPFQPAPAGPESGSQTLFRPEGLFSESLIHYWFSCSFSFGFGFGFYF